jgi:hypothetical protein
MSGPYDIRPLLFCAHARRCHPGQPIDGEGESIAVKSAGSDDEIIPPDGTLAGMLPYEYAVVGP